MEEQKFANGVVKASYICNADTKRKSPNTLLELYSGLDHVPVIMKDSISNSPVFGGFLHWAIPRKTPGSKHGRLILCRWLALPVNHVQDSGSLGLSRVCDSRPLGLSCRCARASRRKASRGERVDEELLFRNWRKGWPKLGLTKTESRPRGIRAKRAAGLGNDGMPSVRWFGRLLLHWLIDLGGHSETEEESGERFEGFGSAR